MKYERKAYAKINLGLDVTGVLPNGYHLVKMIMQTVGIYDTLEFEKREEGIVVSTDNGELPTDENNLIYKAAKLMLDTYGIKGGIAIHLTKRIPIAAGMAGGSTDAAATFHGINEVYQIGASVEDLCKLGVKVGADVPYCIMGGCALAEGIGEVLTPLPEPPKPVLLVAKPDINVSTPVVYKGLDAKEEYTHPDIDGMIEAIKAADMDGIIARLGNVLEAVTVEMHPIVEEIKLFMMANGAKGALMSGSGPTVFGIYDSQEKAQEVLEAIKDKKFANQVFVTSFV